MMDKLKNLPPSITSLVAGLAGAVLYAIQDLLVSGKQLDTPTVVQVAVAAIVAYLLNYGLNLYHFYQTAPGAAAAPAPAPVEVEVKATDEAGSK